MVGVVKGAGAADAADAIVDSVAADDAAEADDGVFDVAD